jgi:hypothetical protein
LDKSSFYDLETSRDSKKSGEFINKVYRKVECQIKTEAIESGILEDAEDMAALVLNPLFKGVTNRTIVIHFKLKAVNLSKEAIDLLK